MTAGIGEPPRAVASGLESRWTLARRHGRTSKEHSEMVVMRR